MKLPKMVRVRQNFERKRVTNIAAAVEERLAKLELGQTIHPGQTVALTAGSRGIANIAEILRATVAHLRKLGAQPFLVPAMGSHGGATAEGQRQLLESYGITEDAIGAPILASMSVKQMGSTSEGYPLLLDEHAAEADHIGVVARIKPHTGFDGPIESGLLKMMMIGLGKHVGALAYHRILLEQPYDRVVRSVGRALLERAPIAFGLAIVENAFDETALLEAVPPGEFEQREEALLVNAKRWLARLPLQTADLLIVDEIGKNISGSGMDTNVVGRKRAFRGQPTGADQPAMRLIFVRGLTEKTHGNATGIGLADFTTRRAVGQMNYDATVINCLTAGYPDGAFLPVQFDTDREVIEAALKIIGSREPHEARILHIHNTLSLEELDVSEPCLVVENSTTRCTPIGPPRDFGFDSDGNMTPIE